MKGYILKSCALFTVIIFLLSACSNLHDSSGMKQANSQEGSITRSSDGCMYSLKATTQSDSPLYYVMEKVGEGNVEKWRKYAHKEEQLCNTLRGQLSYFGGDHEQLTRWGVAHLVPYGEVLKGKGDPFGYFRRCLNVHDREGVEVWVAHATCKEPTAGGSIQNRSNIEMSVAVLTHVDAPFQLHKGISVDLHAFAAQAMHQSGQKNNYLITTPSKAYGRNLETAVAWG